MAHTSVYYRELARPISKYQQVASIESQDAELVFDMMQNGPYGNWTDNPEIESPATQTRSMMVGDVMVTSGEPNEEGVTHYTFLEVAPIGMKEMPHNDVTLFLEGLG